jgi:molybdenum cofactor cytidylyltransferase
LDFRGRPLLQTAVDNALAARFDQVIVAIGGAAPEVAEHVDFGSAVVAENVAYTTGCSSSIVAALSLVDPAAGGLVLMLGDQPGVTVETINSCIDHLRHLDQAGAAGSASGSGSGSATMLVCRYDDGLGHPFGFGSGLLGELAGLQGDKAVWKLLESGRFEVDELTRPGPIPLDVDTWDDYERLLAADRVAT